MMAPMRGATVRAWRLVVGVAITSLTAGLYACTDDFTVGQSSRSEDGGITSDADLATPGDAATDAGAAVDALDALDARRDCPTIAAALAEQRPRAVACAWADPFACRATIMDECSCFMGVSSTAGPAPERFLALAAEFKDAGCTATCSACLTSTVSTFTCEADGGGAGSCVDPALD